MDGDVSGKCGSGGMMCKSLMAGGAVLVIALTWTLGMWFDQMYSQIAITVIALAMAGGLFIPCKTGGSDVASAPAAAKAAPAKAAAKATPTA